MRLHFSTGGLSGEINVHKYLYLVEKLWVGLFLFFFQIRNILQHHASFTIHDTTVK